MLVCFTPNLSLLSDYLSVWYVVCAHVRIFVCNTNNVSTTTAEVSLTIPIDELTGHTGKLPPSVVRAYFSFLPSYSIVSVYSSNATCAYIYICHSSCVYHKEYIGCTLRIYCGTDINLYRHKYTYLFLQIRSSFLTTDSTSSFSLLNFS